MRTKTRTAWMDMISGTATLDGGLQLDTPAWFTWLDEATTRSFAYPIYNAAQGYIEAFMTVRKEQRRRGHAYWTAYSHVGRRLRKVYLGRSSALTDAQLRTVAAMLLERIAPSVHQLNTGTQPPKPVPDSPR